MDSPSQNYKAIAQKLFKYKYESQTTLDFDSFYIDLLIDIKNIEEVSTREIIYKSNLTSCRKLKTRWINSYLKNPNSKFNTEIHTAINLYAKVLRKEIKIEQFKDIYSVKSVEELKDVFLKKLNKWKVDDYALLSDFEGFDKLQKKSKIAGLRYDILNTFYNYVVDLEDSKVDSRITRVPSLWGNIGIDTSNKQTLLKDEECNEIFNNLPIEGTIERYIISPDEQVKLLMQLEKKVYLRIEDDKESQDIITQIALIKALKELNGLDTQIINHYYTDLYSLVKDKSVEKFLGDLLRELGLEDNGRNYQDVKNSLLKLGSMKLESDSYEGREIKGSLLEVFMSEIDGRSYVKVYLGAFLRELIIMDSTFNFDKNVFDVLSRDAQQLAIWLQNRRLKRVLEKVNFEDSVSIEVLAKAVMMKLTNITRVRTRLNSAMQELKDNNLILKDYEYEKKEYRYRIEYIRLPENIVSKIRSKEFKSEELIEGVRFKKDS